MRKQILITFLIVVGSCLIIASEYKTEKVFFLDMSQYFGYTGNHPTDFDGFSQGFVIGKDNYIYIPEPTKNMKYRHMIFFKYDKQGNLINKIQLGEKPMRRPNVIIDEDGNFYVCGVEYEGEIYREKRIGWRFKKFTKEGKEILSVKINEITEKFKISSFAYNFYFTQEGNININHRIIISKNGEFIEYRPSRYYDGQGNFYELFGQDGFMCVSVKDKNGIEINNFKLGSTRTENNNYYITKTGNEVYFIIQDMKTRARKVRQYSVDGKILKEFDGKDTYFNKEEKTGIKMTDRKGPEESWTYENDWEKKGIWIIKKTRID